MNAQTDAKQTYLQAIDAAGGLAADAPGWVRDLRSRARAQFAEAGFPTTRDEAWRYTNLAALQRQHFELRATDSVSDAQLRTFSFDGLSADRLVFVNGRYRSDLSTTVSATVVAGSLAEALATTPEMLEGYLGHIGGFERNPLTALNTAFLLDGPMVRLRANEAVDRPIHLLYVTTQEALAQPRALIVAEAGSRATIIEHHVGFDDGRYFSNALTEIALEAGARVEHYRVQQQGTQGYHVNGLYVRQGRNSEFESHAIDLGGLLVRNDLQSTLAEGASCVLNGLYVVGGRQHVDNHTLIEHAAPRTTSRELYKGVLDGRARAVFNGRVVVHIDAQQSDAQQTNNNLLLSEDAEVDTKPELEIYADDVKCSHGATVGQLDPDQLFYLRARALDEASARDLLTFAFANDVLQRFRLEPMRVGLDRALMGRLLQGRAIKEIELV